MIFGVLGVFQCKRPFYESLSVQSDQLVSWGAFEPSGSVFLKGAFTSLHTPRCGAKHQEM